MKKDPSGEYVRLDDLKLSRDKSPGQDIHECLVACGAKEGEWDELDYLVKEAYSTAAWSHVSPLLKRIEELEAQLASIKPCRHTSTTTLLSTGVTTCNGCGEVINQPIRK